MRGLILLAALTGCQPPPMTCTTYDDTVICHDTRRPIPTVYYGTPDAD